MCIKITKSQSWQIRIVSGDPGRRGRRGCLLPSWGSHRKPFYLLVVFSTDKQLEPVALVISFLRHNRFCYGRVVQQWHPAKNPQMECFFLTCMTFRPFSYDKKGGKGAYVSQTLWDSDVGMKWYSKVRGIYQSSVSNSVGVLPTGMNEIFIDMLFFFIP